MAKSKETIKRGKAVKETLTAIHNVEALFDPNKKRRQNSLDRKIKNDVEDSFEQKTGIDSSWLKALQNQKKLSKKRNK